MLADLGEGAGAAASSAPPPPAASAGRTAVKVPPVPTGLGEGGLSPSANPSKQEGTKGRSDPCRGPLEQNPGVGQTRKNRAIRLQSKGSQRKKQGSRPEAREGSERSSAAQAVEA